MIQWEYKEEYNISETYMNQLGAEGWEYVSTNNRYYVFKRAKLEPLLEKYPTLKIAHDQFQTMLKLAQSGEL